MKITIRAEFHENDNLASLHEMEIEQINHDLAEKVTEDFFRSFQPAGYTGFGKMSTDVWQDDEVIGKILKDSPVVLYDNPKAKVEPIVLNENQKEEMEKKDREELERRRQQELQEQWAQKWVKGEDEGSSDSLSAFTFAEMARLKVMKADKENLHHLKLKIDEDIYNPNKEQYDLENGIRTLENGARLYRCYYDCPACEKEGKRYVSKRTGTYAVCHNCRTKMKVEPAIQMSNPDPENPVMNQDGYYFIAVEKIQEGDN